VFKSKESTICFQHLFLVGKNRVSTWPVVVLSKKLYHHCLVLISSSNGFELEFTIKQKKMYGLMEG